MQTIGFGGGCHWCTEAVFQHFEGVQKVDQGWIASSDEPSRFSEAVLVHYLPALLPLQVLVEAHLLTHSSTSLHKMRDKYRSAVYVMDIDQKSAVQALLKALQSKFERPIIAQTLKFGKFRANDAHFRNYYLKRPEAPFCTRHIQPKLAVLKERFSNYFKHP
ncbi:peptide-methionine (S)-S-oxide reductase [Echinicola vietnamensis]|uniref:peptide-methionine (S)-S-oxide reductase n=1 Tax=Echinicola vietnamensis (strain DSM 17526 / LMG 23754 / KMM 6221) TaxID=926556 RepID=L0FUI0_ECHVK|nr:peptide-methionine (S)-S-oxide reductase [Echinicola vietnamensis]AGA77529.1 peptide methionine sulfoxide reductase [Echinicola vietnamensis DSM 17526]